MPYDRPSGEVFRPTHTRTSSTPHGMPYMTTSNLAFELDRLSPMSEMPPVGLRKKASNTLLKRSMSGSSSRSHKQSTSPILSINAKIPTPPAMLSSLSPLPAPSPVLSYQSSQPSPMCSSASTMSFFSMNSPNPFFATSPYSDSSSRPSPTSSFPSPLTPSKNSIRSSSSPITYSPIYGILPFGPKSNRGVVNLNKAPSSVSLRRRAEEEGTSFFPGSTFSKAHHTLGYSMDPQGQNAKVETDQKKTNALWKITKKWRRNANGKKEKAAAPTINIASTFHRSETISPTHSLLNSPSEPGTKSVHWTAPAPSALMSEKTVSPRMATFPPLAPLTIHKEQQQQQLHQLVGPSPLSPAPRRHRAKVSSSLAGDTIEDDGNDVEECADELEQSLKLSNKSAWRKAGYHNSHRRFLDSDEDNDITNNALRLQGVPSRSPPARAGSPDALTFHFNGPAWTAIRSEGKM